MYIMGGYIPSDTHLFSAISRGEKTPFLFGGFTFHSIYKDGNHGPNLFQFISKSPETVSGYETFQGSRWRDLRCSDRFLDLVLVDDPYQWPKIHGFHEKVLFARVVEMS